MITANRIEFRGYSSVDFDLKTCMAFESDSGEVSTYLTREAVASESYRGEFKRIHNFKYTETFNPKFTFIKDGFGDFTTEEVRRVLRWLTSGSHASFLTVYKETDNVVHFEALGGFSDVSLYKLGNGRTVAIVATFESAHPYAFSPLRTISKDVSSPAFDEETNMAGNIIEINVDTDEPESAIYPRITIQQGRSVIVQVNRKMINNKRWIVDDWTDGTIYYYANAYDNGDGTYTGEYYYNKHNEDGSVEPTAQSTAPSMDTTSVVIQNTYADKDGETHVATLRIANNVVGEKIILDGANRIVSSSSTSRIFGEDFVQWAWLPLYNGTNTIAVTGNCTVAFEYREVRKIGEY